MENDPISLMKSVQPMTCGGGHNLW